MPGFLGGSGAASGGTGGEIRFPKEFVDPVTKLRVSNPENLIDTDFEYGLQPTKWETVELINNTPSFFSKSGDTTIPGIVSVTTNAGTREITVTTGLAHGLAVGIPINVQGSKSVTADGSYIINSIPDPKTFTYLCRDNQEDTSAIEDLYTSIITGEFFQGSQLRISEAEGIVTDAEAISTLTVTTSSAHGFGPNTPFYFLNLNSTISQEFEAANTAAKSFDSSNSATAQTFDGSNTLSTLNIDWSNSATVGGTVSTVSSTNTVNNTITVAHGTENFAGLPLGQPLYYNVTASLGYFFNNPRGVVFLKTINTLDVGASTFQVSAVPSGEAIPLQSNLSGTFQIANQARTFAGNNVNPATQIVLNIVKAASFNFEGANDQAIGGNGISTVTSYSGSLVNVNTVAAAGLDYYQGAMLRYTTTGSDASGLVANATYFVDSFFSTGTDTFAFTLKALPNSASAISITGGTGTQRFTRIGVSLDKDVIHIRNSGFAQKDMIEYTFPAGGNFEADDEKLFYFVAEAYDSHNYLVNATSELFTPMVANGGTILPDVVDQGRTYRVHQFTSAGTSTFTVQTLGSDPTVEYLIVAGGGSGGVGNTSGHESGGGGAGGLLQGTATVTATSYTVSVGSGGNNGNGANTSAFALTAIGGGRGANGATNGESGGSGGGGAHNNTLGGAGVAGQGFVGGRPNAASAGAGGGGAAEAGNTDGVGAGGDGLGSNISGRTLFYAGGGSAQDANINTVGEPGVGGGGIGAFNYPNSGANAEANTGGGGGGSLSDGSNGGLGGSGMVILRYPISPVLAIQAPVATGGNSVTTITERGIVYRVHQFTSVGTSSFNVASVGNVNFEYLVIAGGGGGGNQHGSGGGAGGYRCSVPGEFSGELSNAENTLNLPIGNYPVVVGDGGAGSLANQGQIFGFRGGNSSFHTITSLGGGAGAPWEGSATDRISGGSGGGGRPGSSSGGAGGAGTAGQGFAGENGVANGQPHIGSGGGGAGGTGIYVNANVAKRTSGRGGIGLASSITGTPIFRASGGGGGIYVNGQTLPIRAEARAGGGGEGGLSFAGGLDSRSRDGQPNTGGGGGGSGSYENRGGTGGSGVVIIRYPIAVAV